MARPVTIKRRLPLNGDPDQNMAMGRTVERLARQQRWAWRAVERAVRSAAWLAKEEQRMGIDR
jgi:hypothetical protein